MRERTTVISRLYVRRVLKEILKLNFYFNWQSLNQKILETPLLVGSYDDGTPRLLMAAFNYKVMKPQSGEMSLFTENTVTLMIKNYYFTFANQARPKKRIQPPQLIKATRLHLK